MSNSTNRSLFARLFALAAFVCFALNANATAAVKNLYVQAEAYPQGAGSVYVTMRDDEQQYIKEISSDYGDEAYLKGTFASNSPEDADGSVNSGQDVYDAIFHFEPAEGYEFVCLANEILPDGTYHPANCYAALSSTDSNTRTSAFEWTDGCIINVNNVNHTQDGDTDNEGRNTCFNDGTWQDTPDTQLYAIFRKVGDSTPAFTTAEEGTVVDILPADVKANVSSERKHDKQKNIVVAGSPEKGYKAYFAAIDADHGEELWVTDGTAEGTHMVKDICPGTGSGNPCYLGRLNDKVLFSAYTEDEGQELWVSDGTEEGTMLLADLYMFGDGDPKAFTQINETQAVFVAIDDESAEYDPTYGSEYWLWITDGTVEGTHRVVADGASEHQANCIFPGKDNTTLQCAYQRVGRRVYFKADTTDGMIGEEVWVTDGTEEGTYLVMDINWEANQSTGGTCSAGIDCFANYKNEKLFFQAWTPSYGGEPWATDGVKGEPNNQEYEVNSGYTKSGDAHTYMIKDTHEGRNPDTGIGYHAGCFGQGWEVFADRIWWRGWDPVGGYEIAGSNLEEGDYVFYDVWDEEPSVDHNSYSDPGCIFDGVYMFCAAHGFDAAREDNWGGEMWYTDGTTGVYPQHGDWEPGTISDWIKEQTVCGGSLYWFNETNGEWNQGYGNGLYRLDSKDEAPVVCPLIDPSASSTGDMVHTIRNLGGTVIYGAQVNDRVYCFKYTKPNWDGVTDMGYLEPDFDTAEQKDAIKSVNTESVKTINGVYNLNGVKVGETTEGLQKGIYVVNGKKVVVK